MTKTNKLLKSLQDGNQFTAAQIQRKFGIRNPTASIDTLRLDGYSIYLNERKASKNTVVKTYRLGTPSRRMVAQAFEIYGAYGTGMTPLPTQTAS